jgi:RNA-directed DNA polymerase
MHVGDGAIGPARPTDWQSVNWRKANRQVRNLRQRIFRATQAGDWNTVLVDHLMTCQPWRAKPAKRVYIPKPNGKLRPLGISTILDRCLQARIKNALEPSWEARFEGSSYGFRPGRSCYDAIGKIYQLARPHKTKKWVVDADIQGAFDNISHTYLLETIGDAPGRELIKQWLKAGYVENLRQASGGALCG